MRLNESTVLTGPVLRLVPYRREHVARYNEWMQEPELLELTCSEPLTLEEEVANQRSWWLDDGKLTFIICASDGGMPMAADATLTGGMCGDVNAFFSPLEPEEADGVGDASGTEASSSGTEAQQQQLQAELEVMIAERDCRRRGLGRQACAVRARAEAPSCFVDGRGNPLRACPLLPSASVGPKLSRAAPPWRRAT
eukprot:6677676-Prymnesium_polylepis.1